MTAKTKLAQKRLTLLQLAEKLGNVSKACQMHKVSRSQFYEYKRAFQLHGLDGLIDKPPIPGSHPNELTEEIKIKIIDLSHQASSPRTAAYCRSVEPGGVLRQCKFGEESLG